MLDKGLRKIHRYMVAARDLFASHGTKLDGIIQSISNLSNRLSTQEALLMRLQRNLNPSDGAASTDAPDRRYWRSDHVVTPVRFEPGLQQRGRKVYSQNDEDGIIEHIFSRIGGSPKFFVEFGIGPPAGKTVAEGGLEGNCLLLAENGWQGLFMDGGSYPAKYQVMSERISPLNINLLFEKYGVPLEFDLLSIDLDGQDFWVWGLLNYFPRVVIMEYNPSLSIEQSCSVPFDVAHVWDGTQYYGASLLALNKLAISKGYTLVYANGINAFFIRNDQIANPEDFQFADIYNYRGTLHYLRADPLNRAFKQI